MSFNFNHFLIVLVISSLANELLFWLLFFISSIIPQLGWYEEDVVLHFNLFIFLVEICLVVPLPQPRGIRYTCTWKGVCSVVVGWNILEHFIDVS